MENQKNTEYLKTMANVGDEEIRGVHNAIKNFVEAKKGEENAVDKGKKGFLKGILTKMKGKDSK